MSANSFALLADEGFQTVKPKNTKKDAKPQSGTAPKKNLKDANTKGGRNKGTDALGHGTRPPKRQYDRHVSGTGRYRGEKKGGNTKGGSGEKLIVTEADAVVEEVKAAEEVKVEEVKPEEPEEKVVVLDEYKKKVNRVAGDKKAARAPVAAAEAANVSTKAPVVQREVIVTKPGKKTVNASKKTFNLDEFHAVVEAAPEANVRRAKKATQKRQFSF